MSKLQGKVALVTGASKGIGAAIALELAAQGAAVAVNYSGSKAGAEKVVNEIKQAGGKAIAVQANVADPDTIGPLIETVVKQLGPISILVNNAGIYEFGPLESRDARALPQTVQCQCSRAVCSQRRPRSSTSIQRAAASSTSAQ